MKKKLLILVLLALAAFAAWRFLSPAKKEGVAARYREYEVSWTQVEQTRKILTLLGEKGDLGDRAVADRILRGYILWDEAKALGISVSESDAAAALSQLPLPDGKESVEDYLRRLGGSLEDYMDTLKAMALGNLSLDRLRETLAREACAERHIDFDPDHLPEEVSRIVGEKIESLVETHRDEIEYYF